MCGPQGYFLTLQVLQLLGVCAAAEMSQLTSLVVASFL